MPETFLLLFLLLMLFRSFARFSRSVAAHTEHEHVRGSNSLCTPFFSSLHLPPSLTTQHDTHFLLVFLSFITPLFPSLCFLHFPLFLSSSPSIPCGSTRYTLSCLSIIYRSFVFLFFFLSSLPSFPLFNFLCFLPQSLSLPLYLSLVLFTALQHTKATLHVTTLHNTSSLRQPFYRGRIAFSFLLIAHRNLQDSSAAEATVYVRG